MKKHFYSASEYVDEASGYTCRYNYSHTENFQLHFHDYYEVFMMISGEGIHLVNNEEILLNENSLIFVRPWDTHSYIKNESKKFSFINLTFTKETAETLFRYLNDCIPVEKLLSARISPAVILNKRDKDNLISRFERLHILSWENRNEQKLNMKTLLMDIFVKYFSNEYQEASKIPDHLEKLTKKMNNPGLFSKGIGKMIELSGYSREHLSRLMKKYYNTTLTEFINSLRINYACNMLINTDVSIASICYDSGFSNLSWFYKVFTKNMQITPAEFREKYSTKNGIK